MNIINMNPSSFGNFSFAGKSKLSSNIFDNLPVGNVVSVIEDADSILVKQKDGRAEITSHFVNGVLREHTEKIDGNTFKTIYSKDGKLTKKIKEMGNIVRTITFKDGVMSSSKLDIFG